MRVLVDSSVWIDFLNGHESPQKAVLTELISQEADLCTCGVVVAEVFQGLRRTSELPELEALFRDLAFLGMPGIDTYLEAAELYRELRRRGITVRSTIDCLIALLAKEHRCALLFRDRDMSHIVESRLLPVKSLIGL